MSDQPLVSPEKLAPNSPDGEIRALGSILWRPGYFDDISEFLSAPDFFDVRNAKVWQAMERLHGRGDAIDYSTVIEELRKTPDGRTGTMDLELIGGSAYITFLLNQADYSGHAETYARIVERAAVRRRLLSAAADIAQAALEENDELSAITARAEDTLDGAIQRKGDEDDRPIQQIASEYYDQVEKMYTEELALLGVSSGYTALDELLFGFQPDTFYVIGARPSVGKTALATYFASAACRQNVPVLFLSLEMDVSAMMNRFVCSLQGLDTKKVQLGQLRADGDWERFTEGIGIISKWPLTLKTSSGLTIPRLRKIIRKFKRRYGKGIVIVDYLQLMVGTGKRENRQIEINGIATGLKELAKTFHLPVIACCQLSREVEKKDDKRPELAHLRESGGIENDADVVALIWRPELGKGHPRPGIAVIDIAKNRNGPTGEVEMTFQKEYVRYTVPLDQTIADTSRRPVWLGAD